MKPNKLIGFCFGLAFALAGLAAFPVLAADGATVVIKADPRSGKLVRRVVTGLASTKPEAVRANPKRGSTGGAIGKIVEDAAEAHKVDPLLVHSMIKVESNYNPYAISSKGAEGLMQLMPGTARDLGVTNSFDPRQNIEAGVRYLKQLKELYKDDQLALAAYNAGPGAVKKWGNVPPYPETLNYVRKVGRNYGEARRAADNAAVQAKAAQAQAAGAPTKDPAATAGVKEEEPKKVEQFIDANGRLHLRTR